ncbi:MAG: hypothetical protein IPK86_03410 [Neisseriales bacterium]|nr:MAG: hypothetical protein IPK86_03410 [Neisseriales bacterium]
MKKYVYILFATSLMAVFCAGFVSIGGCSSKSSESAPQEASSDLPDEMIEPDASLPDPEAKPGS